MWTYSLVFFPGGPVIMASYICCPAVPIAEITVECFSNTGSELKIKSAPRKFHPCSPLFPHPSLHCPTQFPSSSPRQAHHGCAWRRNLKKKMSPVARKTHFQNIKTFLRRRSSLSLSPCLFLNSWSEIKIVVL